jgi:hypothetical protein
MAATTWDADRLQPQADGSARGYRLEGGEWVIEDPLPDGAFGAMGGLATSVRDFSKYVTAHLGAWPPRDDPELGPLRRSSMREMAQSWRSTAIEDDSGILAAGYGYGLKVEIHRRYGRMVGHSGGLPGFGSHAAWLPDHGVGLMVFANRTYAKARLAVGLALEELAGTGALVARRSPTSPDLIQAQQGLAQLYGQWDDRVAGEIVLETATLDRDDDRRWPDLAELSSRYGACVGLGPIEPTGALRGSWRMDCQRGSLQLTVMLGPTCPKIQFLSVKELVPPGGEPSA